MAGERPTLILVTGPPGSGKTTLAHELAQAVGCPTICRDEIKEGMVLTVTLAPGSDRITNLAATQTFVAVLRTLLEQQVSVVAEAAFQHELWCHVLGQLDGLADVVVVRCLVDDAVLHERLRSRAPRAAHDDDELLARLGDHPMEFDPIHIDTPTIDVDTTTARIPTVAEIAAFVTAAVH